jgi:hypothetical protein
MQVYIVASELGQAMAYTVLPFGVTSTQQRRLHYPLLLTDIVRDCSDAINALRTFEDLISNTQIGDDTTGYRVFDGHVGETACHIRAGVLLELFFRYRKEHLDRNGYTTKELQITTYVERLELTRNNAQTLCSKLTSGHVCHKQIWHWDQA